MTAFLGHALVVLALMSAVSGAALSFRAGLARDPNLAWWGRILAYSCGSLVAGAVAVMLYALVTHDFSVKYVADVGSREIPLYYTIISLWGALEGSILFWAFLLSAYTSIFLLATRDRFVALQPWITGVLLLIATFFLFVIAGPGNPFAVMSPIPSDGAGLNPLLQNHPMMGLHPPLLYLGYVGLSVPYAIAIASLITRDGSQPVLLLIRRWALIPWIFLSLGIIAGMWWSYAVLGWGGYWSWDPVENASVMPWLVTTAFLHSLQVQQRRQMLKVWTVSLIIAAFLLSILGTFLTRSGVIASVHSFTQSAIGPVFLAFFGIVLIGSLALLFERSADFDRPGALDAIVCRETAFLFNNLLLVAITFTILLGTLFPLLGEALQGTQFSVGAPYFNHVAVPAGVALLFLMGVGPALPWGASRLEDLQWRFLVPVALGVGTVLLLLAIGVRGAGPLAMFGLAGFVLTVTAGRIWGDLRHGRGSTGSAWRIVRSNPRRYGGYVVHVGVLLVIVGIGASQSYGVRGAATLRPGQSISVDGYRLTFLRFEPRAESNRMVLGAALAASRGGQNLGTLTPSQNYYVGMQQPVVTPAVREEPLDMVVGLASGRTPFADLAQLLHGRNPFEDLYLVLEAVGANPHDRTITVQVLVNPLVGIIWLGGFVIGLGGLYALTPAVRRRRVLVEVSEPIAALHEEVVV